MTVINGPRVEVAQAAAAAARRVRAEWLLAVAGGLVTPTDVLRAATGQDGGPLLRLRLSQLLRAQDGWGTARVRRVVDRIAELAAASVPPARMTVGWLLDPRAGGRRWLMWCEVMHTTRTVEPWPGFPFTTAPPVCRLRDLSDVVETGGS